MQRIFRNSTVIIFAMMTAFSFPSWGRELQQILRDGVIGDPKILEAQANQRIAQSTLEQTEAALWPVVKASANQPMINSSGKYHFNPGLEASWRVYDFGATQAGIERDRIKTQYYHQKTIETAEELAYELASDYLEALKAKLSLQVAKENLARHNHIVQQLSIILEYDPGRRSEYTQAQARQIQVRESIISYERALGLALRRLARYVNPPVAEAELTDPFTHMSVNELLSRYSVSQDEISAHPSYRAQARELESIEAALKVSEQSRYPAVGLNAQANKDDAAVYLTVSMDVFNKATQPGIEEQKYYAQAARARLNNIYDSLTQRADVATLEMREDQARIEVAEAQIHALEQVAVDYEDQFKIATRTLLDVVNAYSELSGIKQLQVEAEYDLMKAKLDYLSATGALTQWAGIPDLGAQENSSDTTILKENQPLKLISVPDSQQNTQTAPHVIPEKVFVRVSQSGELLLEANGRKLDESDSSDAFIARE